MKLFQSIVGESDEYGKLVSIVMPYYDEFHRRYHDSRHIIEGAMRGLDLCEVSEEFQLSLSQQLAWLFHDIVYIPFRDKEQNERDSAHLMQHILRGYEIPLGEIDDGVIEEASVIILDTINHHPSIEASKPIIDIDLYGFSNEEVFIRNNRLIQDEFGVHDDQAFMDGQQVFLNHLVGSRNTIYTTQYAKKHWEAKAQVNIKKFLQS